MFVYKDVGVRFMKIMDIVFLEVAYSFLERLL